MDFPDSMDDCLYFTNRKLPDGTRILAYVEKKQCPECGEAKMGKPINEKTGRPKTRSSTYECPACGHEEKKKEHEEERELLIQYTNPENTEEKSTRVPYKRRTWKGVKAFVFENEFTGETLGITKKLKAPKGKSKPSAYDPDDD